MFYWGKNLNWMTVHYSPFPSSSQDIPGIVWWPRSLWLQWELWPGWTCRGSSGSRTSNWSCPQSPLARQGSNKHWKTTTFEVTSPKQFRFPICLKAWKTWMFVLAHLTIMKNTSWLRNHFQSRCVNTEQKLGYRFNHHSLRRGPTGPSSLAPATQGKMHPFIIIKW